MSETPGRSLVVSAIVFCGLGAAIFLLGAVIGYCRGAFGDEGTAARGFDWAVKTGLLVVAMSATLGVLGGFVFSKLQPPAFVGWAFVIGLAFAIMNGGGVLLGMNEKELWPEIIKGFLGGALVGAISGSISQRNHLRRVQKTQFDTETSTDPTGHNA
ncbi:MAG: hypothetical protein ACO1RT_01685 [Planctomycetaceae bacterium]